MHLPSNIEIRLPGEAVEYGTHVEAVGMLAMALLTAECATLAITTNRLIVNDNMGIPRIEVSTVARRTRGTTDPAFDQLVESSQALQRASHWTPSDFMQGRGPCSRTEAILREFHRITNLLPDSVSAKATSTMSAVVAHALIMALVKGSPDDQQVMVAWLQ